MANRNVPPRSFYPCIGEPNLSLQYTITRFEPLIVGVGVREIKDIHQPDGVLDPIRNPASPDSYLIIQWIAI